MLAMITGVLPVNCSIHAFVNIQSLETVVLNIYTVLKLRKRYLLCGKQKQVIENFRREQERNGDREKKREWPCCFYFPAFLDWYS